MPSLLFFIVYIVGSKNVFRAKLAKKIMMAKAADEKKRVCSKMSIPSLQLLLLWLFWAFLCLFLIIVLL